MMFDLLKWVKPDWHPTEDDLLLYSDGELFPRQAAKIHEHLESCWPCRVRAEKYREIISQLVDCVTTALAASIPPPPNRWSYFASRLHNTSLRPRSLGSGFQYAQTFVRSEMVRLASGGAVLLILSLVFIRMVVPPGAAPPLASAGDLLRHSTDADLQRLKQVHQPVIYQKLRIRAGRKSFTREVWRDASNHRSKEQWPLSTSANVKLGAQGGANATPPEAEDLKQTFASNNMAWDDPLSAQSYDNWRNNVGTRSEQVVRDGDRITVSTSILSPNGPESIAWRDGGRLVAAHLTLRTRDLHPISEILDLRSWVDGKEAARQIEVAELNYEVVPLSALNAAIFDDAVPALGSAQMSRADGSVLRGAVTPSAAELTDSEMAARFALHKVGADLSAPITVELRAHAKDPGVTVTGILESVAKKQEVLQALSGIPYIHTDLKTEADLSQEGPSRASTSESTPSPGAGVPPPHSPIEKQLLRYFQNQGAVEAFSEQAFSSAESLMAHAWAWRRLSERYGAIKAGGASLLRPSSQQLIEVMLRDHRDGMRADATALMKTLEPVLISSVVEPTAATSDSPLFDRASRVEALTLYLLFGNPASESVRATPEEAAQELLEELQLLCSELEKQQ
jgi:hypothetical protein